MPDRSRIFNNDLRLFILFGPPRHRRFQGTRLALRRCHAGRPCGTALQSAQPPQRHRRRILAWFFVCHGIRMTGEPLRLKTELKIANLPLATIILWPHPCALQFLHEAQIQKAIRPLDAGTEKVESHFHPPAVGLAHRQRLQRH